VEEKELSALLIELQTKEKRLTAGIDPTSTRQPELYRNLMGITKSLIKMVDLLQTIKY